MSRLLILGADRARLFLIASLMAASVLVGGVATVTAVTEWLADRNHPEASRTYRISARAKGLIEGEFTSLTPRSLGDRLNAVRSQPATTIVPLEAGARSSDGSSRATLRILYVDERFPAVFDYGLTPALLADMARSGGLALTPTAAARLAARPGQEIVVAQERRFVTAILDTVPGRSHLEFDAIAPSDLLRAAQPPPGVGASAGPVILAAADATTYTVVDEGDLGRLGVIVQALLRDLEGYEQEAVLEPLTGLRDAPPQAGDPPSRFVQSSHLQELVAASAIAFVALLGAASSLPLLFTSVLERQRRVLGMLGALGYSPGQLTRHFAREMSILLGTGLGGGWLGLAALLIAGGGDSLRSDAGMAALAAAATFTVAMTVLTATITLVLARRRFCVPIIDLLERRSDEGSGDRSILITLSIQAALSFLVIGSAALIFTYLDTTSRAGQAYAKVWAVELTNPGAAGSMLTGLEALPEVMAAEASAWRPYAVLGSTFDVSIRGQLGQNVKSSILVARGDLGEILGQTIIAGSGLENLSVSSCRIMINETLAGRLALGPADAIGQRVDVNGIFGPAECVIAGVVEDQRFGTGRAELAPTVHMLAGPAYPNYRDNYLLVRTRPGVQPAALRAALGDPDDSLEPVQLGSIAREAYRVENNLLRGLTAAALVMLAVSIATLASSVALSLETRTVEIGVRRALGHRWREIMVAIARPALIAVGIGAGVGTLGLVVISLKWIEAYGGAVVPGLIVFATPLVGLVGSTFIALAINWIRLRRVSPAEVLRS